MYNFDLYLKSYLEKFSSFSLEGIGYFSLPEKNSAPFDPQLLIFKYDKKAPTNRELTEFISEKTGKNISVIKGAVDAYISMNRELINIGNPYILQGIGMVKLSNSGQYTFTPFDQKNPIRKVKTNPGLVPEDSVPKNTNKIILLTVAILIVVGIAGVIGWGGYQFIEKNFFKNSTDKNVAAATLEKINPEQSILPDSIKKIDSVNLNEAEVLVNDSTPQPFMFIYETTLSKRRAESRTAQLKGYGNPAAFDSVTENKQTIYRLFLEVQVAARDTVHYKDSIQRFLQKDIKIIPIP